VSDSTTAHSDPSPVERLAASIGRAGLVGPARLALDIIAPLDVLSAQCALFAAPFTTGSRWHDYISALSNERGWQDLRSLLAQRQG